METVGVCRCCLAEGLHKGLHTSYTWLDKKEIYSDMLQECFNIIVSLAFTLFFIHHKPLEMLKVCK